MFFPLLLLIFAKFNPITKTPARLSTKLPKAYPLIGSFIELIKNKERFVQWSSEIVLSTQNLTFTLDRPYRNRIFITANPANVDHILKSNFSNYNKGDHFRTILRDFLGDGIFNVDGDNWKFQRQIASHEFNTKSLRKFVETVVDSELCDRLIPILQNAADEKIVVDFQDILQRFAFDNVCRIAFGYDPACLSLLMPQEKFEVAFEQAVKLSSDRFSSFTPLFWKIKRAFNIGSEKQLKIAIDQVRKFAKEMIQKKKQELLEEKSTTESIDLLSRFLSSGYLDEDCIADTVISFILAGRDTTTAALTWFFWLLSNHTEVENEILKEIKDKSESADYHEIKKMIYTHASLCESMRLYPPVPVDSRAAENDDILPDGTIVKRGMRVTYNTYAMGRVEKVWGKDWAQFRPTRWLDREKGDGKWSFVGRDPYIYPVFHAGPRICLGKDMAFLQMKTVVSGVLRKFRVVPVVEDGLTPVLVSSLTTKMKGGFLVRVVERTIF